MSFGLHTGGQAVRTRPDVLEFSGEFDLATGAFSGTHTLNLQELSDPTGYIRTMGFRKLSLYAKATVAAEVRLLSKRGALDVDPDAGAPVALAANTKTDALDVDLTRIHSFALQARSTAAVGKITLMMRLI